MQATLALWAAAAAWAGVPAPTGGRPVAGRCSNILNGRVLDADLGAPVEGAAVAIAGLDAAAPSDAAGAFRLEGVCAGEHVVVVSKVGFEEARVRVRVPLEAPLEVALAFPTQDLTVVASEPKSVRALPLERALEGEALERVRGLSLGDTLRETPGVTVLRSGAVNVPVIDGFFGSRVLIVNDGLRHHSQLWSPDHAPEIDPFQAHRLVVLRGADGVRFGADGIGGTISLEPPPFLEPDAPGLKAEANLVGAWNGRQGIANLSLLGTVPDVPNLAFRAQASGRRAASASAPDYPLDNTGAEDWSGAAAARWKGEGWTASLGASHVLTTYGIFSGLRAASPRDLEAVIARGEPPDVEDYDLAYTIRRPYSRAGHSYVRGELTLELDEATALRVLYGFQHDDRREFELTRRPTDEPQVSFDLSSHALELSLERALTPELKGVVGTSLLLQLNDHDGRRLIPDYERRMGGLFALGRWRSGEIELSAGARYERQGLDTEQPARIAPNQNPPDRARLDLDALMGTTALSWTPSAEWRLDLHVAAASRIPSIDELFIDGLVPGEIYLLRGDRALSPERTHNVGLGLGLRLPWLEVDATGYVHYVVDYIYRAPLVGADGRPAFELLVTGRHPVLEYRNVDALFGGGTVGLTLRPFEFARLRSRATYVRGRNLSDDDWLVNVPPDRYEHRLTFSLPDLGPVRGLEIYGESLLVLRQTLFDREAELAPPPPSYHLVNAGLAARIEVGPTEVRASIDVQNLLDTSYRDYLSRLRFFADEPGFGAFLRLSVSLEANFETRSEKENAP